MMAEEHEIDHHSYHNEIRYKKKEGMKSQISRSFRQMGNRAILAQYEFYCDECRKCLGKFIDEVKYL